MLIKIILCLIPLILGILLKLKQSLKALSEFLIGFGVLNLISETCKFLIMGHPKPYIGSDVVLFMINNMAFLAMPILLFYLLIKSYKLDEYKMFPWMVYSLAVGGILFCYPTLLAGASLILALRAYYLSVLGITLLFGVILFFYRKANLPQTMLLLAAAEGILQYLIAIFSPGWWMSWIVLSLYYLLIFFLVCLPRKYIDQIDSLTIETFDK